MYQNVKLPDYSSFSPFCTGPDNAGYTVQKLESLYKHTLKEFNISHSKKDEAFFSKVSSSAFFTFPTLFQSKREAELCTLLLLTGFKEPDDEMPESLPTATDELILNALRQFQECKTSKNLYDEAVMRFPDELKKLTVDRFHYHTMEFLSANEKYCADTTNLNDLFFLHSACEVMSVGPAAKKFAKQKVLLCTEEVTEKDLSSAERYVIEVLAELVVSCYKSFLSGKYKKIIESDSENAKRLLVVENTPMSIMSFASFYMKRLQINIAFKKGFSNDQKTIAIKKTVESITKIKRPKNFEISYLRLLASDIVPPVANKAILCSCLTVLDEEKQNALYDKYRAGVLCSGGDPYTEEDVEEIQDEIFGSNEERSLIKGLLMLSGVPVTDNARSLAATMVARSRIPRDEISKKDLRTIAAYYTGVYSRIRLIDSDHYHKEKRDELVLKEKFENLKEESQKTIQTLKKENSRIERELKILKESMTKDDFDLDVDSEDISEEVFELASARLFEKGKRTFPYDTKELNIAILGGKESTKRHLLKLIPKATYYDADEIETFNASGRDIVVIITSAISHPNYYRAKDAAKACGADLLQISNSGIKAIANRICDKCDEYLL